MASSRNTESSPQAVSTQKMCTDVYFQQLLIWLLYFFFFNVKKYVLFIKNYVQLINSPMWLQTLVTSYNAQVMHIMLNTSGKPIQSKAALWHMVWKLPQKYKVTGWESTKLNQPNTSRKIHGTGSEHRETKPQKLSLQFFAHSYRNIPTDEQSHFTVEQLELPSHGNTDHTWQSW